MRDFSLTAIFLLAMLAVACSQSDTRVLKHKLSDTEITTAVKAKLATDEGLRTLNEKLEDGKNKANSEQVKTALVKVEQLEQSWGKEFAQPLIEKRKDVVLVCLLRRCNPGFIDTRIN